MALEVEAKIRVDDLVGIRERLNRLGAVNEGLARDVNWVFNSADGSLARSGVLLRLRSLGDPGGIVTVKRPVDGGDFKTREEVECMVDSSEDFLKQLEMLGYVLDWIYERRRQTWLWRDCVLALDEMPELGCFVEIEGDAEKIREVCAELGLDPQAHIDDNYLTLWKKHLEVRGEKKRNMLFDSADS